MVASQCQGCQAIHPSGPQWSVGGLPSRAEPLGTCRPKPLRSHRPNEHFLKCPGRMGDTTVSAPAVAPGKGEAGSDKGAGVGGGVP